MALAPSFKTLSYDKVYFYLLLVFAFTTPLSRAAVSFFIVVFPLIWLIEGNYRAKLEQIKSSPVLLSILVFILFELLSILWSDNLDLALSYARMYSYLICLFVLATVVKKEWTHKAVNFFLYGMLVSEFFAYLIFFDIYAIKGQPPEYPSPFMFHIDYSIFLAFTSILLLNRIFSNSYTRKKKLFIFLFFATVTINLFISTGRTGQLAFLVALFVSIIIHFKLSVKSLLFFALLSASIFYGAYKTLPLFETRVNQAVSDIKLWRSGNYQSSWGLRALFWVISSEVVKEHPLLGVGLGDYREATKAFFSKSDCPIHLSKSLQEWCEDTHFHNQYLMVLVQSGIIGLVLLLAIFFYLYRLRIKDPEIKEISILFTTVYLVSFIAEPLFMKQFPLVLFVLFGGLFIASASGERRVIV